MTARLKTALKEHFRVYRFGGSEWVFHHTRTRRHHLRGARVFSLRGSVHNAVARANVALERDQRDVIPDGWRMHDLRHRRVTTWLAEGQNVVDVQQWMGHSDIKTTMHYFHYVPKHLRPVGTEQGASAPLASEKASGE